MSQNEYSKNGIKDCAETIYSNFNNKKQMKDDNKNAKIKAEFVTVIVGAGASASLKTQKLIEQLTLSSSPSHDSELSKHGDRSESDQKFSSQLKKEVFDTNAMVHFGKNLKECTLEELFSILAKIKGEKSVPAFLNNKNIYNRLDNIRPTQGYEFLAHIIHHKLINCVISTNFDEELEISLDDEIGQDNYKIIKSLSEFDAFGMDIEKEKKSDIKNTILFNKPILFKVHGTISYPRTIRATIENVKKFENEKLKVIKWVLCHTTILIIVGFSFRDLDFEHAFSEALKEKAYNEDAPEKIDIFWIHINKNKKKIYEDFLDNISKREIINKKIGAKYVIAKKSDDFFKELAEEIEALDNNNMIPTFARQKIRNLILEYPKSNNICEKKFYIEVILFALTAKGLFGVDALKDCIRIQRYCNYIINRKFETPPVSHTLRSRSNPEDSNSAELQCYEDANSSLYPDCKTPNYLLKTLETNEVIIPLKNNRNIYYLPEYTMEQLTTKLIQFFNLTIDKEQQQQLQRQLTNLQDIFDVDIVVPDASVCLMFRNPMPISDHKKWEEKTEVLLKNAKALNIIAQTGEWITKDKNKDYFTKFLNNGGIIKLITCEPFEGAGMHSKRQMEVENKLKEMESTSQKGKIEIKHLQWGLISEHIKLNDTNQGMYMKRIAKSSIVAPIWVEGEDDCKVLEDIFDYYWIASIQKSKTN